MEREYHSDAEESDSEERTYDETLEYFSLMHSYIIQLPRSQASTHLVHLGRGCQFS